VLSSIVILCESPISTSFTKMSNLQPGAALFRLLRSANISTALAVTPLWSHRTVIGFEYRDPKSGQEMSLICKTFKHMSAAQLFNYTSTATSVKLPPLSNPHATVSDVIHLPTIELPTMSDAPFFEYYLIRAGQLPDVNSLMHIPKIGSTNFRSRHDTLQSPLASTTDNARPSPVLSPAHAFSSRQHSYLLIRPRDGGSFRIPSIPVVGVMPLSPITLPRPQIALPDLGKLVDLSNYKNIAVT
jgi:hypothetical protein